MQARLENWINGPGRRLVHQPAALLRRAISRLVQRRDDGSVDHEARLLPDESQLPIDPSTDVPTGYVEISATSQAGSPAIPT